MEITKVLNNNVVMASKPNSNEAILLIGKGIGFNKKKGERIDKDVAESVYRLENESEQEKYKQLLPLLDEEFISFMHDVLSTIEQELGKVVNEHVHIGLTDHIAFAIKRYRDGIHIKNPFLIETKVLYPKEYQVAKGIIKMINKQFDIQMPESEIGLIALHIHSAITDKQISKINEYSELIYELISMIEKGLHIKLKKDSINYYRLVQHLRHALERANHQGEVKDQSILANVLKQEYPICYNLAWKLVKVMQKFVQKQLDESEVVYLTIHLQRLTD